jgi:hypothetical protein
MLVKSFLLSEAVVLWFAEATGCLLLTASLFRTLLFLGSMLSWMLGQTVFVGMLSIACSASLYDSSTA